MVSEELEFSSVVSEELEFSSVVSEELELSEELEHQTPVHAEVQLLFCWLLNLLVAVITVLVSFNATKVLSLFLLVGSG